MLADEWPGYGTPRKALTPDKILNRHLTADGSETGSKEANVNGAITPVDFWFEDTFDVLIYRLIIDIEASGNFALVNYGSISTLANGLKLLVTDSADAVLATLTPGAIVSVAGWTRHCYDGRNDTFGSGDNAYVARWTFTKAGGPLLIRAGCKLKIVIRDDLTSLSEHHFFAQGTKV